MTSRRYFKKKVEAVSGKFKVEKISLSTEVVALMRQDRVNAEKANKKLGRNSVSIKETSLSMGISMGAYDNYNCFTRYPAC